MARPPFAPGGPGGVTDLSEGRWLAAADQFGVRVAEWSWDHRGDLTGGRVRAPDHFWVEIRPCVGEHPVLGAVDAIDYRDISVLSSYRPLEILDLHWAILSEIDEAEAFSSITAARN